MRKRKYTRSPLDEDSAAIPNFADNPQCVLLRLTHLRKHGGEVPHHLRFQHLGPMHFVDGAGDTAQQGALLVGIQVSDGGILREFGAIPFVQERVRAFFIERHAVLGNRAAQKPVYEKCTDELLYEWDRAK